MLNIIEKDGKYAVEWSDSSVHVFDAAGLSESAKNTVEKLVELYARLDPTGQAEMRGALRLVEDGLASGYIEEDAETLLRVYDLSGSGQKGRA